MIMVIREINANKTRIVGLQQYSWLDYLIITILILYAGRGNTFFQSGSFVNNPIGVALPLILSIFLALRWKIVFNKHFYLLIFCYFIYFIAITIKFGEFRPTIFLSYCITFFVVYAMFKALRFNLFLIYEKSLYLLSIIALFLWLVQTTLGGDTLYGILSRIPNIGTFSYVTSEGLNAILYSVQPSTGSMLHGIPIPRNCGYAWEPGAFAVYICLAIYVNLFLVKNDKSRKFRLWVLLFALLSTQSTTGYSILLVILFFYFLNKNVSIIILLSPILIVLLALLFSLPFMGDKIADVFRQVADIELIVENSITSGASYAPGRFASFVIAFRDFMENPILGLGSVTELSWTNRAGASIGAISGIGYLLAQFGVIGFLFFIISTVSSSALFAKRHNYKGTFLLLLLILLISVSYNILFLPVVMSFWGYRLFNPND